MAPPADEIDRQARQTRDRMDEGLDTLETRGADIARYGRIAAIVLGAVVVAGVGVLVYRRVRRPSRNEQLQRMLVDALHSVPASLRDAAESVRDLPDDIKDRLKHMPSVRVVLEGHEPGTLESVARKVAPAVAGTVSAAVMERLARTFDSADAQSRNTPPDYN
ncbi:MAG: hypothetical protein ABI334_03070 [Candidatus Dormiibacterota bacterium]